MPVYSTTHFDDVDAPNWAIIVVGSVCGFIIVVLLFILLYFVCRKHRKINNLVTQEKNQQPLIKYSNSTYDSLNKENACLSSDAVGNSLSQRTDTVKTISASISSQHLSLANCADKRERACNIYTTLSGLPCKREVNNSYGNECDTNAQLPWKPATYHQVSTFGKMSGDMNLKSACGLLGRVEENELLHPENNYSKGKFAADLKNAKENCQNTCKSESHCKGLNNINTSTAEDTCYCKHPAIKRIDGNTFSDSAIPITKPEMTSLLKDTPENTDSNNSHHNRSSNIKSNHDITNTCTTSKRSHSHLHFKYTTEAQIEPCSACYEAAKSVGKQTQEKPLSTMGNICDLSEASSSNNKNKDIGANASTSNSVIGNTGSAKQRIFYEVVV